MVTGGTSRGMHAGKPYGLALLPYLALSMVLHGAVAGPVFYQRLVRTVRGGVVVQRHQVIQGTPEELAARARTLQGERVKRYRLAYLHDAIIPIDLPDPALPVPEPPKPAPKPAPKPTPPKPEQPATAAATPPTGQAPGDDLADKLKGTGYRGRVAFTGEGEPLNVGEFELFTVRDQATHTHIDFQGYHTVYIVSDISDERGIADLFNWMQFFHDLLHQPGVVQQPWVLGVGVALKDPYYLTPGAVEDSLTRRWDESGLFGGPLWGDVGFDSDHELSDNLGLDELPQPKVFLVDSMGNVNVEITGRLEDLTEESVIGIATEIKDIWGMSAVEFMAAKLVIFNWQQQLKSDKLGEPVAPPAEVLAINPPPINDPNAGAAAPEGVF